MLRVIIYSVVLLLLARALAKFWRGLQEGLRGTASGAGSASRRGAPALGVQMTRDPVCGTFIIPAPALSLGSGSSTVYFCSAACRDKYRESRSVSRDAHPHGRTA